MVEWINQTERFFNVVFSDIYSKFIIAILIILIGLIIGRILNKIVSRILHEIGLNSFVKNATHFEISLEELIGSFTMYFIYFISFIMALNQLNVTTTVLTMISGAVLLIIIISSMLALKDFIPNLIAGIYIHKKKFIKQGDKIQFKNISGIVLEINLVETKIQMKNKDIVFIPNSQLTKQEIIRKN